jgi:hypothetical protein
VGRVGMSLAGGVLVSELVYVDLFEHGCAVMYRGVVLQRVELMFQKSWFGRTGWSALVHSVGFRFRVWLPGSG